MLNNKELPRMNSSSADENNDNQNRNSPTSNTNRNGKNSVNTTISGTREFDAAEFLAETSIELLGFDHSGDVFDYIASKLQKLTRDAVIVVCSFDEQRQEFFVRSNVGLGRFTETIMHFLGKKPNELSADFSEKSFRSLQRGELFEFDSGLFDIFGRSLSKEMCAVLTKLYHIEKIFALGITSGKTLFATALIALQPTGLVYDERVLRNFARQLGAFLHATAECKRSNVATQSFANFARQCVDVFYTALPDGTLEYISESIASFGYAPSLYVGRHFFEFVVDEDYEHAMSAFARRVLTGKSTPIIYRIYKGDGTIAHVEDIAEPEYHDEKLVRFHGILHDVTDKVKHGKIIREHNIRFERILSHLDALFVETDIRGNNLLVTAFSRGFGAIFPTEREKIGRSVFDFFHADDRPKLSKALLMLRDNISHVSIEAKLVPCEKKMLMCKVTLFFSEADKRVALVIDLQAHKHFSGDLSHGTEHVNFRALCDKLPVSIVELLPDGRIAFLNTCACEKSGYSAVDINMGLSFGTFFDGATLDFEPDGASCLTSEREFVLVSKTGAKNTVLGKLAHVNTSENLSVYICIFVEIEMYAFVRKQLDRNLTYYNAVIERTPDMIFIYDGKNIIFANANLCRKLGFSSEELLYKSTFEFFCEEDSARIESFAKKLEAGEDAPNEFEAHVLSKDGKIFTCECLVTVLDKAPNYSVLIAMRDISEKRDCEVKLQQNTERVEFLNRNSLSREQKMIELKDEINELRKELGLESKYFVEKHGSE